MAKKELNFEETVLDDVVYSEADYLEVPTSRNAFFLVAVAAALAVLAVGARVYFLNFGNGRFFAERARANVSREISLPARRALITDRFGEPMVNNRNSFSVFMDARAVFSSKEDFSGLIIRLAEILKIEPIVISTLLEQVDFEKTNWVPVARNLTSAEVIEIKGLNSEALEVVDDYEREYPEGEAFAHLLGYTGLGAGNSVIGKTGLELEYDEVIRGRDGKFVFYEDALGRILDERIVNEPISASLLETTVDGEFQKYFYRRLKNGLAELGRDVGVGVALNPKSGEILALVSLPSFDANVFADRSRSGEREAFLKSQTKPLFNRVVSGLYSPGSTIKPLVALAARREGLIAPEDEIFSAGFLEIPNPYFPEKPSIFLDWRAHGWVTLVDALARSSNIYFYLVGGGLPKSLPLYELARGSFQGAGLGIDKFNEYWKKFGFGSKTGVDIPFESAGFLPNQEEKKERTGENWLLGDTYNVSIGQGDLLVTPLQLVNFMATIGNGGILYKPFIKKGASSEILADYSSWREEIKDVQIGIRDAVLKPYGSAHLLNDLPIKVAGKTGTPQIQNRTKINAFFAGYAPADDPEIAILVLIENARDGSLNALPIAKDVFRWYYENRIKSDTNIRIDGNEIDNIGISD
ncbi:MAG TPA: penicillin-binding transpeptidase domain-containing protein [Candidatus Paceibacterota bacterium]